jgi:tRNA(fMet)-specific endonuclease VapC
MCNRSSTGIVNRSLRGIGNNLNQGGGILGVVLDSTIVIAAERSGKTARQVLEDIAVAVGDTEVTLSVITVIELSHGLERAKTADRRVLRERFIDELLKEIPVEPVTIAIAFRAGKLDGSMAAAGIRIALGDLLIGTTALELGYPVATHN